MSVKTRFVALLTLACFGPVAVGCVSHEYVIPKQELQRLVDVPPHQRGERVYLVQDVGSRRANAVEANPEAWERDTYAQVYVDGYIRSRPVPADPRATTAPRSRALRRAAERRATGGLARPGRRGQLDAAAGRRRRQRRAVERWRLARSVGRRWRRRTVERWRLARSFGRRWWWWRRWRRQGRGADCHRGRARRDGCRHRGGPGRQRRRPLRRPRRDVGGPARLLEGQERRGDGRRARRHHARSAAHASRRRSRTTKATGCVSSGTGRRPQLVAGAEARSRFAGRRRRRQAGERADGQRPGWPVRAPVAGAVADGQRRQLAGRREPDGRPAQPGVRGAVAAPAARHVPPRRLRERRCRPLASTPRSGASSGRRCSAAARWPS